MPNTALDPLVIRTLSNVCAQPELVQAISTLNRLNIPAKTWEAILTLHISDPLTTAQHLFISKALRAL